MRKRMRLFLSRNNDEKRCFPDRFPMHRESFWNKGAFHPELRERGREDTYNWKDKPLNLISSQKVLTKETGLKVLNVFLAFANDFCQLKKQSSYSID
jgi:hypothetical protein